MDLWQDEAKAKGFKNTAEYVQSFNQFERVRKAKEFQKKIRKPVIRNNEKNKSEILAKFKSFCKGKSSFTTTEMATFMCGEDTPNARAYCSGVRIKFNATIPTIYDFKTKKIILL